MIMRATKTDKSKCGAGSPGKPGFGKGNTCGKGNGAVKAKAAKARVRAKEKPAKAASTKQSSDGGALKAWHRAMASAAKTGLAMLSKANEWVHHIWHWGAHTEKIPKRLRTLVLKPLVHTYFSTFVASKRMIYKIARDEGLNPIQSYKVAKTVSALDFAISLGGSHSVMMTAGHAAGLAVSMVPAASLAYLSWKATKNPIRVIKASYWAVKHTAKHMKPRYAKGQRIERYANGNTAQKVSEEQAKEIAQAVKKTNSDLLGLYICTAFDMTHNVDKAIALGTKTAERSKPTKYRYAKSRPPERYQLSRATTAPNPAMAGMQQMEVGAGSFTSGTPGGLNQQANLMRQPTMGNQAGGMPSVMNQPVPSQYAHQAKKKKKPERNNGKEKKALVGLGKAVLKEKPEAAKPVAPPEDQNAHDNEYDLEKLPESGLMNLDLDDQEKFTRFKLIPVMDEHGLIIGKDQVKKPINVAHLKLMAKNSNDLAEQGEYAKILIGHTKDEGPETDQPVHVGFAKNFTLGKFRNKPCLLADLHIRKSLVPMALTYPHRSPELFRSKDHRDQNFVDAISLLRRAPERPLGLLTYGRAVPKGVEKVRYARDFPALRPAKDAAVPTGRNLSPKGGTGMALDAQDIQAIVTGVVHGVVAGMRGVLDEIEHKEDEELAGEEREEEELADIEGELGEEEAFEGMEGEGAEPPEEEEPMETGPGEEEEETPEEMEEEEEAEEEPARGRAHYASSARGRYASSAPSSTNVSIPKMHVPGLKKSKGTSHAQPHPKKVKYEAVPSGGPPAATLKEHKITGAGTGVGNEGVERMAKTQAGIELNRYARKVDKQQKTIDSQTKRIRDLERYARAAERERDLASLAAQGYRFDMAQELADCVDLAPAAYDRHMQRIIERYERDPIDAEAVEVAPDRSVPNNPMSGTDINGLTQDDSLTIARYARDNPQMSATEAVNDWIKKNMDSKRMGGRAS
jgi:hypothetical protein